MKWYAIVFNKMGMQVGKSPLFPTSAGAIFWAEAVMRGVPGSRYQLFQA